MQGLIVHASAHDGATDQGTEEAPAVRGIDERPDLGRDLAHQLFLLVAADARRMRGGEDGQEQLIGIGDQVDGQVGVGVLKLDGHLDGGHRLGDPDVDTAEGRQFALDLHAGVLEPIHGFLVGCFELEQGPVRIGVVHACVVGNLSHLPGIVEQALDAVGLGVRTALLGRPAHHQVAALARVQGDLAAAPQGTRVSHIDPRVGDDNGFWLLARRAFLVVGKDTGCFGFTGFHAHS